MLSPGVLAAALSLLLAATPVTAADPATEAAWAALAEPGTVALMRHAKAPGGGDPPGFRLDDCKTQRNLDDEGRAQARAAGEAIRNRGIRFDQVLSSQWCRCKETAALLGLGPVAERPWLNSLYAAPGEEASRTRDLRAFIAGLPKHEKAFIVTHQFNIRALLGRPTGSGDIVVVGMAANGEAEYRGRIRVEAK